MKLPDIRQAADLIDSGEIDQARVMLQNILHVVPQHLSVRVLLARIFEAEGDHPAALVMWKQAAFYGPEVTIIEEGLRHAILRKQFGKPGEFILPEGIDSPSSAAPISEADTEPASEDDVAAVFGGPTAGPSPASRSKPADPVPEFQDLDKLIEELESAAIVPDPDIPMMDPGDLDLDIEDVVSETLARIYANQSYFEEAAQVYEKLAQQHPDRREEFLGKVAEMKGMSS
ncbi:MAG: hypothetical protein O2797_06565 [Bacteroidetes bacterium]|nr:hypothetical protein [Bacteroidota bacterium]MDA1333864.1 hypothetical protein [Bacteroidota bacterium]